MRRPCERRGVPPRGLLEPSRDVARRQPGPQRPRGRVGFRRRYHRPPDPRTSRAFASRDRRHTASALLRGECRVAPDRLLGSRAGDVAAVEQPSLRKQGLCRNVERRRERAQHAHRWLVQAALDLAEVWVGDIGAGGELPQRNVGQLALRSDIARAIAGSRSIRASRRDPSASPACRPQVLRDMSSIRSPNHHPPQGSSWPDAPRTLPDAIVRWREQLWRARRCT